MMTRNAFLDDLPAEDFVDADGNFNPPTREAKGPDAKTGKFPCQACNGTGRYLGTRLHQPKSECFVCRGKGFFMTSERDRQKAKVGYRTGKAKKLTDARTVWDEANPGLATYLKGASEWSTFAAELLGKLNQYGYLTQDQTAAVAKMRATTEARKAAKAVERGVAAVTVDLQPIRDMFERARKSGYKLPIYRAAGLIINRAPDHGRNPGALYVKDEAENYLGKILGTEYVGKPAPALLAIAADPRGEAIKYGQRTGNCSCCGRLLTAEGSINAGIGPICASKWGL